ncbi:MAG: NAD(P)-dependent dehydrogenase (short-subunit alcohol dehydrogenase family) [Hyphomicrobiaceae bacterium]|jgi:NAD(P)-dependent dehydrogenase (short-subunit alcohol dehydrogenase family)
MARFADKLALVTGASRGIGRAVAKVLAREGAHVILAARREGSLEDVDDEIRSLGGSATLVKLDVTAGDKVDALGPTIYERWGKLDILVANAGILGPLSPLHHISDDAWDNVMAINLTANWRLIRTLDPLLRHANAGRAVFVSSGASAAKNAYWGPYAASKAGLEALVKTYAHEIATTNVRANIINPGPVRTEMRQQAFPGEDPMTLPTPEDIAEQFLDVVDPACVDNGRVFSLDKRTK